MLYEHLYNQLCAIEAIGVCRQGPHLSQRGQRLLGYLRTRRGRMFR
jgi:hypothetical protein